MNQTLKSLKTPLRYPGGKSRATKYILPRFPDGIEEYRETFLGGGSVAIAFTKANPDIPVWVNDLYEPLYNFWRVLQDYDEELCAELVKLKQQHPEPTSAKNLFLESKQLVNNYDQSHLSRACYFYVVNKCSFSGLTESSSFSKQASVSNFAMSGIARLTEYEHLVRDWKITNLDYKKLFTDKKDVFTYLDPPYDIKDNLYGQKGGMHKKFDHDKFAEDCDRFVGPMLISYNNSQMVKDRFVEWTVAEFAHTYTMRSVGCYNTDQAGRKELVLLNYEM